MDLGTIRAGLDLLARVPGFVRRPFTVEEARAIQAARLRDREALFLDFMRRAVYALPDQPIHQLLQHAGCTFGDLEALVAREGLEGALGMLLRQGVYLTVDEFKGRKPAVRGSATIATSPDRLRNPLAAFHIPVSTSGSRSGGTPILLDLEFIRGCAVTCALYLHGRGGWDWAKVMWEPTGAGARYRLLKFSCYGAPIAAWFTQVDPAAPELGAGFRWGDRGLRWGARLGGVRFPKPVLASADDPSPVLRYVRAALDRGETPYIRSFASTSVRLATLALETGVDISGTKATLGGEPTTKARLDVLAKAGIEATPRYGSMENGPIAVACLRPEAPDDMHLVRGQHALIQVGDFGAEIGMPARALLITGLHPKAPFTMLNVSMGDEAELGARDCGCPMQDYGWTPHLKNLRSYEKLTAGGMTFHDSELIAVLERVLPERFGGHPADYQLVEREDAQGKSSLALLVHPRLGPVDEAAVADAFLQAIGKAPAEHLMASIWRQTDMVRVERSAPLTTATHKILHLHVDRGAA